MKVVMASESPETAEKAPFSLELEVSSLAGRKSRDINITPPEAAIAALSTHLGLQALRKVSLKGVLAPVGKRDWRLTAHLGATIVQPCVVTLAPVTTRIEEDIERIWRANMPEQAEAGSEEEMPEDTSEEQLGSVIDLGLVLGEALALALPLYPRADGAHLEQDVFAAPGVTPMRDEEARPFAGLAGLRDKLAKDDSDNGGNGGKIN